MGPTHTEIPQKSQDLQSADPPEQRYGDNSGMALLWLVPATQNGRLTLRLEFRNARAKALHREITKIVKKRNLSKIFRFIIPDHAVHPTQRSLELSIANPQQQQPQAHKRASLQNFTRWGGPSEGDDFGTHILNSRIAKILKQATTNTPLNSVQPTMPRPLRGRGGRRKKHRFLRAFRICNNPK